MTTPTGQGDSQRLFKRWLALAGLLVVIDQATKRLIVETMAPRGWFLGDGLLQHCPGA